RDRLRLEASPSIAPPLVVSDRPQTFFVHAAERANVSVRFGARAAALQANEIGQGLFRVEYDPKRDRPPFPADGPLQTTITVDAHRFERELLAATPLAHPRWLALSPSRTLVVAVSEETDELAV